MKLEGWQEAIESWRQRFADWLPPLFVDTIRLHCIDAGNGNTTGILSIPRIGFHEVYFQHQQQMLYFASQHEGSIHLLQYAYPFHKPWLLIFSWSLGIFAALATLQVLLQQIKRMLKRKPVS